MLPEMPQNDSFPVCTEEAVQIILSNWSEQEKEAFSELKWENLDELKVTLGLDIRNQFQLWSGNPGLLRACMNKIESEPLFKTILWNIFYAHTWEDGIGQDEIQNEKNRQEEKEAFEEVFSNIDAYLASELILFLTWLSVQKNPMNLVQLSQVRSKE